MPESARELLYSQVDSVIAPFITAKVVVIVVVIIIVVVVTIIIIQN